MRTGHTPIWLYLGVGFVVAAGVLFWLMGGTVDDLVQFASNPSAGFPEIGAGSGGGFQSPVKGVMDGVGGLGDSIGGALRGAAR